ncbi:hypothetical protein C0995_014006 [Termitomyces sp. Mi166|nr:hypothetical protein C0995_014006 [Termitomyces sp. Mi166\
MLQHGNKCQVADGVQVPVPKQPLTKYHPVNTPKSPPSASTEASSSQGKEPKVAKEKLPPRDKGKKLMKLTVEEVPEESLLPIHLYSRIPEIQITEPMPKNVTTADRRQDGAYKTLWEEPSPFHSRYEITSERVMPKRITNANMANISEIPDNSIDNALPFPGKSPLGTSANHSNANSLSTSIMELEGTVGMVDPVEAFYSHWPPEHCASLSIAKDTDLLKAIMAVIDGKEEVECIVDSGSQIVSMLEKIVHHLGLVYDPTVMLNMQSTNGAIDQS